MVGAIAIIMAFSIPLAAILGSYYVKIQKMKLENEGGGQSRDALRDLRTEVGQLMSENEELKDRVKNLEAIMSDESRKISLDYEKEQIRLDKNDKFEY